MSHSHHDAVLQQHHQNHEHFHQHPHLHVHQHPLHQGDHIPEQHEHHHQQQNRRRSLPEQQQQLQHQQQPRRHSDYRSSRSAVVANDADSINLEHLFSCSGILELAQLILGSIAILIILGNHSESERRLLNGSYQMYDFLPILFTLESATSFFICTCCLLLATALSSRIKPIYEFVYHLIGAFCLFATSATLYARMLDEPFSIGSYKTAAIICFTNSLLYLANAIQSRYLSTLLKLAQLTIGCACVFLVTYYFHPNGKLIILPNLLFLLMASTFMIGTFTLLIFSLFSSIKNETDAQMIYELFYHTIAGISLLVSSIYMIVRMQDFYRFGEYYRVHNVVGALGILNALLYGGSASIAKFSFPKP